MPGTVDLYSFKGRTRQQNISSFGEGVEDVPAINSRGELLVAQALPPKTELVRLGQTWTVRIATGSAFTFVAGYPGDTGTRAELVLYNGERQGGKSYVLDSAWVLGITSIAAAASIALLGQQVPAVVTANIPAQDTAQLITSRNGKVYAGSAIRAVAVTTMVTNMWDVLATSQNGGAATAQIGLSVWADLYGGWILRPGDMFGLQCVAGTAVGTAIAGITWHELQLPVF